MKRLSYNCSKERKLKSNLYVKGCIVTDKKKTTKKQKVCSCLTLQLNEDVITSFSFKKEVKDWWNGGGLQVNKKIGDLGGG